MSYELLYLRRWICVILILLALNAFSLNLGYSSPTFGRLIGFLSLIIVIILYSPAYKNISRNRTSISGIALILLSLFLLFLPLKTEYWLISLPIFICGFDLLLKSANASENVLPALSLGSLIYAVLYIFYIYTPVFWMGIDWLSESLSVLLGLLLGVPLSLGPTISGFFIFLTFFCNTISFFILSEREKRTCKAFLVSAVALLIAYAIYISVHSIGWMTSDRAMGNLYIAFIMFTIPFIVFGGNFKIKPMPVGHFVPGKVDLAAFLFIFLAVISISTFPYLSDGSLGKLVIYERDCEMNFDLPRFPEGDESFGPYSGFSVGAFGLYIANIGYKVEYLNYTNPQTLGEALEDADVLMIINLNKSLSSGDLESIWNFTRNGGNLLVFGDHTSMFVSDEDFKSGKDYLNEILLPTGIRVNPDTADNIQGHWIYATTYLPHFVTKDLGIEITTSSVGASLDLRGTARPVIIGRYSFSDKADPNTPGHLGNRSYERGEKLGDLILAASDTYGKGNILVFGDTSYIFNSEMPFRYKLARDSMAWLMSHEYQPMAFIQWISFAILGLIAAYYLFSKQSTGGNISRQATVSVIIALSLLVSGALSDSLIQTPEQERDIAWIDHSHLNQFNLNNYEADSIDGLATNLIRNGYMPLVLDEKKDFSEILKGNILASIAPNERYSPQEAAMLKDFVEEGGLLIMTAGHESKGPLDSVLKSFNIDIGNVPLGSPPWIVETHATGGPGVVTPDDLERYWHQTKFMDAYPVLAAEEFKPIAWLNYGGVGYNLAISKKFGNGEVVLVGDSRFLLNENLEYASDLPGKEDWEQYQLQWLGNIELLRKIISEYQEAKT